MENDDYNVYVMRIINKCGFCVNNILAFQVFYAVSSWPHSNPTIDPSPNSGWGVGGVGWGKPPHPGPLVATPMSLVHKSRLSIR